MPHLPQHLKADISDGIDPNEVLAVECNSCGKYLGQWYEFDDADSPWIDEGLCEECWDE